MGIPMAATKASKWLLGEVSGGQCDEIKAKRGNKKCWALDHNGLWQAMDFPVADRGGPWGRVQQQIMAGHEDESGG